MPIVDYGVNRTNLVNMKDASTFEMIAMILTCVLAFAGIMFTIAFVAEGSFRRDVMDFVKKK